MKIKPMLRWLCETSLTSFCGFYISMYAILLISWIGAKMVVSNELTTGNMMSLLAYCMNILMSLMMVSMVIVMISMSSASIRRISEVLNDFFIN